jgi:hypothetical protein
MAFGFALAGSASTPASATPTLTGANTFTSRTDTTQNYVVTISNYSTLNALSGATWATPTTDVGTVSRSGATITVVVPANYQGAINVGIGFTETGKTQSFGYKSTVASLAVSATPTITGGTTVTEGSSLTFNVTPVAGASYAWSANEGSLTPSGASAVWTPATTGINRDAEITCIVTEAGKLPSDPDTHDVAVSRYGNSWAGVMPSALTGFTGQAGVYSVHRVVPSWTGAALRVNGVDVGFLSGTNELDEQALLTATGTTGTPSVTTIYDQSGNGRHLTLPSGATAPYIVVDGVIQRDNVGNPMIVMLGSQLSNESVNFGLASGTTITSFVYNTVLRTTGSGGTYNQLYGFHAGSNLWLGYDYAIGQSVVERARFTQGSATQLLAQPTIYLRQQTSNVQSQNYGDTSLRRVTSFRDSAQTAQSASATADFDLFNRTGKFRLGAFSSNGTTWTANADMGFMCLIISPLLNDTNRLALEKAVRDQFAWKEKTKLPALPVADEAINFANVVSNVITGNKGKTTLLLNTTTAPNSDVPAWSVATAPNGMQGLFNGNGSNTATKFRANNTYMSDMYEFTIMGVWTPDPTYTYDANDIMDFIGLSVAPDVFTSPTEKIWLTGRDHTNPVVWSNYDSSMDALENFGTQIGMLYSDGDIPLEPGKDFYIPADDHVTRYFQKTHLLGKSTTDSKSYQYESFMWNKHTHLFIFKHKPHPLWNPSQPRSIWANQATVEFKSCPINIVGGFKACDGSTAIKQNSASVAKLVTGARLCSDVYFTFARWRGYRHAMAVFNRLTTADEDTALFYNNVNLANL